MIVGSDGLREETCCTVTCGVRFAIPEHVYQQARRLGEKRSFSCPNGHAQFYRETEEERLKQRVERLERELADVRASWASNMKSIIYWKGMATRWKRKAGR